jgi:hypothetical protein
MRATRSANLILLDLITIIIFNEGYRLIRPPLLTFLYPHVISPLYLMYEYSRQFS